MKKLLALRPILYQGRLYEAGSELPAFDARMVAAWLRAKSAKWAGDVSKTPAVGRGGK